MEYQLPTISQKVQSLTKVDLKRPKQANLRRAVSTAYYALFHFLVEESCRNLVGSANEQRTYRDVLARAFEHGAMKDACASFSGGTLPKGVSKGLPTGFQIEQTLQEICAVFVDAQEKRHLADYDRSERFGRSDVQAFIADVTSAIEKFARLAHQNARKFFLASLVTWKTLKAR
ncbi:MAG: hypothetical protein K2Y37_26425 [Pirellulales bacterium]|nr:hypothetical protein [Pirellulales bacterium]